MAVRGERDGQITSLLRSRRADPCLVTDRGELRRRRRTHDGPDEAEGEDDDWGDDDGATQSYTPAQVGEIAAALQLLTPEILAARWDPANPAAKEVYGFRPDDETRDYAVDYYTQVRELVLRLAETGSGLFVGIF